MNLFVSSFSVLIDIPIIIIIIPFFWNSRVLFPLFMFNLLPKTLIPKFSSNIKLNLLKICYSSLERFCIYHVQVWNSRIWWYWQKVCRTFCHVRNSPVIDNRLTEVRLHSRKLFHVLGKYLLTVYFNSCWRSFPSLSHYPTPKSSQMSITSKMPLYFFRLAAINNSFWVSFVNSILHYIEGLCHHPYKYNIFPHFLAITLHRVPKVHQLT